MLTIYCKNTGSSREVPEGTSLQDLLPLFDFEQPHTVIAAKVNNVLQGLRFRVYNNRDVEFLDYTSYSGRSVYCRSLCFLLSKAVKDLFPSARILMRRPICKGYYCILEKKDGSRVCEEDVRKITARMQELVEADHIFKRHDARTEDVIELFSQHGYEDKVKLLKTAGDVYTTYYTLDGTPDYYYDALVPSSSYLKVWDLCMYHDGLLLRVPNRQKPDVLAPFEEQSKTFDVLIENMRWNSIMGLDNVGDVNEKCLNGGARDLIQVAEALQERKIVKIAEDIANRHQKGKVKLVLITGPTSSGKSTFCQRLSVQLKACGIKPLSFSTDDYFVNRMDTPRLPDGSFDFDNFDTVDHDMLQRDVLRLLAGDEVDIPEYNFVTGLREYNGKKIQLKKGNILLIEGIHALNPMLTDKINDNCKYRIFINTMTSYSLDDHNSIPTSDNRLLRRIVRDHNKGAFTAQQTISNWPNVRRSEGKWIYPYQEKADVLFNSAYLVEFAVLRPHAEMILRTVPRNSKEYSEALRLLNFLSYFTPVSDKDIPSTSLIKSFII
ncbi:MAG: nucleoside kinase [Bacteroidales bacterium]|nr:nucleoside kinase [Candidatus Cryptobacteroides equifaecalis]